MAAVPDPTSTVSSMGTMTTSQDPAGLGTSDRTPGVQGDSFNPNATISNATLTDVYVWTIEPYKEAIAVPVVFGLIFIVGLIGNGTLIFTVAMNKVREGGREGRREGAREGGRERGRKVLLERSKHRLIDRFYI